MTSEDTPTVASFRAVYGQMCAEWCRDDALAEFDRFIARIKAGTLREALSKVNEEAGANLPISGLRIGLERAGKIVSRMADQIEKEAGL